MREPEPLELRDDVVLVEEGVQRAPERGLVGQRHEELVDDNAFVLGLLVVVGGNRPDLGHMALKALPSRVRSVTLADTELAVADLDYERFDLFRPVRSERAWVVPAGEMLELLFGERLLRLQVFVEKATGLALRQVGRHLQPPRVGPPDEPLKGQYFNFIGVVDVLR